MPRGRPKKSCDAETAPPTQGSKMARGRLKKSLSVDGEAATPTEAFKMPRDRSKKPSNNDGEVPTPTQDFQRPRGRPKKSSNQTYAEAATPEPATWSQPAEQEIENHGHQTSSAVAQSSSKRTSSSKKTKLTPASEIVIEVEQADEGEMESADMEENRKLLEQNVSLMQEMAALRDEIRSVHQENTWITSELRHMDGTGSSNQQQRGGPAQAQPLSNTPQTHDTNSGAAAEQDHTLAQQENKKKPDKTPGSKPFRCEECGIGFTRVDALLRHKRTGKAHVNKSAGRNENSHSYAHHCPECGKGFLRSDHLSRHRWWHDNRGRGRCSQCREWLPSRPARNQHMWERHGVRLFVCEHCAWGFIKASYLKRHLREIHSDVEGSAQPQQTPNVAHEVTQLRKEIMNIHQENAWLNAEIQKMNTQQGSESYVHPSSPFPRTSMLPSSAFGSGVILPSDPSPQGIFQASADNTVLALSSQHNPANTSGLIYTQAPQTSGFLNPNLSPVVQTSRNFSQMSDTQRGMHSTRQPCNSSNLQSEIAAPASSIAAKKKERTPSKSNKGKGRGKRQSKQSVPDEQEPTTVSSVDRMQKDDHVNGREQEESQTEESGRSARKTRKTRGSLRSDDQAQASDMRNSSPPLTSPVLPVQSTGKTGKGRGGVDKANKGTTSDNNLAVAETSEPVTADSSSSGTHRSAVSQPVSKLSKGKNKKGRGQSKNPVEQAVSSVPQANPDPGAANHHARSTVESHVVNPLSPRSLRGPWEQHGPQGALGLNLINSATQRASENHTGLSSDHSFSHVNLRSAGLFISPPAVSPMARPTQNILPSQPSLRGDAGVSLSLNPVVRLTPFDPSQAMNVTLTSALLQQGPCNPLPSQFPGPLLSAGTRVPSGTLQRNVTNVSQNRLLSGSVGLQPGLSQKDLFRPQHLESQAESSRLQSSTEMGLPAKESHPAFGRPHSGQLSSSPARASVPLSRAESMRTQSGQSSKPPPVDTKSSSGDSDELENDADLHESLHAALVFMLENDDRPIASMSQEDMSRIQNSVQNISLKKEKRMSSTSAEGRVLSNISTSSSPSKSSGMSSVGRDRKQQKGQSSDTVTGDEAGRHSQSNCTGSLPQSATTAGSSRMGEGACVSENSSSMSGNCNRNSRNSEEQNSVYPLLVYKNVYASPKSGQAGDSNPSSPESPLVKQCSIRLQRIEKTGVAEKNSPVTPAESPIRSKGGRENRPACQGQIRTGHDKDQTQTLKRKATDKQLSEPQAESGLPEPKEKLAKKRRITLAEASASSGKVVEHLETMIHSDTEREPHSVMEDEEDPLIQRKELKKHGKEVFDSKKETGKKGRENVPSPRQESSRSEGKSKEKKVLKNYKDLSRTTEKCRERPQKNLASASSGVGHFTALKSSEMSDTRTTRCEAPLSKTNISTEDETEDLLMEVEDDGDNDSSFEATPQGAEEEQADVASAPHKNSDIRAPESIRHAETLNSSEAEGDADGDRGRRPKRVAADSARVLLKNAHTSPEEDLGSPGYNEMDDFDVSSDEYQPGDDSLDDDTDNADDDDTANRAPEDELFSNKSSRKSMESDSTRRQKKGPRISSKSHQSRSESLEARSGSHESRSKSHKSRPKSHESDTTHKRKKKKRSKGHKSASSAASKSKSLGKRSFCLYCKKAFTTLSQHLRSEHGEEDEVIAWVTEEDREKADRLYSRIEHLGNRLHGDVGLIQQTEWEKRQTAKKTKAHLVASGNPGSLQQNSGVDLGTSDKSGLQEEENCEKLVTSHRAESGIRLQPILPAMPRSTEFREKKCYCPFCKKSVVKLLRHLQCIHKEEEDVKSWMRETDKVRADLLYTRMRNLGNHMHNVEVLKDGRGELAVRRRPSGKLDCTSDDFVPCPFCLGYFSASSVCRHVDRSCCFASKEVKQNCRGLQVGWKNVIEQTNTSLFGALLSSPQDAVLEVIQKDTLILQVGGHLINPQTVCENPDSIPGAVKDLRAIAKILIELRNQAGRQESSLSEFLEAEWFDVVAECMKSVARRRVNRSSHTAPRVNKEEEKLQTLQMMGSALSRCCQVYRKMLTEEGSERLDAVKTFQDLCLTNWWRIVSDFKASLAQSEGEVADDQCAGGSVPEESERRESRPPEQQTGTTSTTDAPPEPSRNTNPPSEGIPELRAEAHSPAVLSDAGASSETTVPAKGAEKTDGIEQIQSTNGRSSQTEKPLLQENGQNGAAPSTDQAKAERFGASDSTKAADKEPAASIGNITLSAQHASSDTPEGTNGDKGAACEFVTADQLDLDSVKTGAAKSDTGKKDVIMGVWFPLVPKQTAKDKETECEEPSGGDDAVVVKGTVRYRNTKSKVQHCLYCKKRMTKIRRHLMKKHANEEEVKRLAAEADRTKRDIGFTQLRNLGNHLHNVNVLKKGEGQLFVKYRTSTEVSNPKSCEQFAPCTFCFGYFKKRALYTHINHCSVAKRQGLKKKHTQHIHNSQCLLPSDDRVKTLLGYALSSSRSDKIDRIIESDRLIQKAGELLLRGSRPTPSQRVRILVQTARYKMRSLGKLVLELRHTTNQRDACLEDFLDPEKVDQVVEALKSAAEDYQTTSFLSSVNIWLGRCVLALITEATEKKDVASVTKLQSFDQAWQAAWDTHFAPLQAMKGHKRKRPVLSYQFVMTPAKPASNTAQAEHRHSPQSDSASKELPTTSSDDKYQTDAAEDLSEDRTLPTGSVLSSDKSARSAERSRVEEQENNDSNTEPEEPGGFVFSAKRLQELQDRERELSTSEESATESSDTEDDTSSQKTKKKKRKHKTGRKPHKNSLSNEELEAVHRRLGSILEKGKVPSKKDILRCLRKERPVLKHRTWLQIKGFCTRKIGKMDPSLLSRHHVTWSDDQREAVYRQLGDFIEQGILPGKTDVERCKEYESVLASRSWRNIKDFCRNTMKKVHKTP